MNQITLYYKQGASDKIYKASIEPDGGGYSVRFAYGRRGATLQTGTKTQAPVSLEQAKKIYDKLIAEKSAKGYTPGADGTPYQHTDKAQQSTGILPQLLNTINADEAAALTVDPGWWTQEKFDGRRIIIRKTCDQIDGINRKGLIVGLPDSIASTAAALTGDFIVDGESVGDEFIAFDLLELSGVDYRGLPYGHRLRMLMQAITGKGAMRCVETATDTANKAEMIERLRDQKKEGAVFKRSTGTYMPGRPSSGGDALKLKFYESASFLVSHVNDQRSVGLSLLSGKSAVAAGNVTIPPNFEIPQAGQVIECRYLYAFAASGVIYQPVYLGRREDITAEECTTDQLKYKTEPEGVAA